jgi:hypothetical protein
MAQVGDNTWTSDGLRAAGFIGWVTFETLTIELETVPRAGGVYVVTQGVKATPDFLSANLGGRFKGRDPTVDASVLQANWVHGADVVYIGKADNLRRRLREFAQFGSGKPIGHWGGRLIWQLTRSAELLIAWRETPGMLPKEVEKSMLSDFRAAYGRPPFANNPHLLGR